MRHATNNKTPASPTTTCGQFHQHSMSSFYTRRSRKRKKDWQLNLTVFFTHLGSAGVKAPRRMLMKLTPGINFINVLWADPESTKNAVKLSVLFALVESGRIKVCA